MTNLLSVPDDLLVRIVQELSLSDRRRLSFACHAFDAASVSSSSWWADVKVMMLAFFGSMHSTRVCVYVKRVAMTSSVETVLETVKVREFLMQEQHGFVGLPEELALSRLSKFPIAHLEFDMTSIGSSSTLQFDSAAFFHSRFPGLASYSATCGIEYRLEGIGNAINVSICRLKELKLFAGSAAPVGYQDCGVTSYLDHLVAHGEICDKVTFHATAWRYPKTIESVLQKIQTKSLILQISAEVRHTSLAAIPQNLSELELSGTFLLNEPGAVLFPELARLCLISCKFATFQTKDGVQNSAIFCYQLNEIHAPELRSLTWSEEHARNIPKELSFLAVHSPLLSDITLKVNNCTRATNPPTAGRDVNSSQKVDRSIVGYTAESIGSDDGGLSSSSPLFDLSKLAALKIFKFDQIDLTRGRGEVINVDNFSLSTLFRAFNISLQHPNLIVLIIDIWRATPEILEKLSRPESILECCESCPNLMEIQIRARRVFDPLSVVTSKEFANGIAERLEGGMNKQKRFKLVVPLSVQESTLPDWMPAVGNHSACPGSEKGRVRLQYSRSQDFQQLLFYLN